MTTNQQSKWEHKRTDESRLVEEKLREAGFESVDAYRYNSASIRVRVIDGQFESIPREARDRLVDPTLDSLPDEIQSDIVSLVLIAPSELNQFEKAQREFMQNMEFENPSPSIL